MKDAFSAFDAMSDRWEILLVALIIGATHVISPRVFGFRKTASSPRSWRGFSCSGCCTSC